MQILEIKILRGPNYWSIRRPNLIQMKLELEELEYRPSNKIEGFSERIEQLMPTLIEHRCSEGGRGGFFKRVEDGTWMGHIIEHIALELQTLAGMYSGFGRTRGTGEREGVYYVAFDYHDEETGIYTAKAAVRIAQALVDNATYDLKEDIQALQDIHERAKPHPTISAIAKEANRRNIPCIRLNNPSWIQLGCGIHQTCISIHNGNTTADIALDRLFPNGSNGRIPIIAVIGTNDQTTTAQITAHIVRTAGKNIGHTSKDGIYIQNQLKTTSYSTGFDSAQFVLKNPTVDFAVLECSPYDILRSGLGFQQCDVAIVTNILTDYLDLRGINNLEQLVRTIQVVPETVCDQGYTILNADDDLVYKMQKELRCKIALFSTNENNKRIQKHCEKGGKAAVLENGYITIMTGKHKVRVMPIKDVTVTYEACTNQNIVNVLPAVLSTYLFKEISIEDIRQALRTLASPYTQIKVA